MQRKKPRLHLLLHAANLVEERLRRRLSHLGIGPRQARILNALSRMERVSQIELAREFDVTAASMSTMASRLVEAGLISRNQDPDERRNNVLSLTAYGFAMLDEIHDAWGDVDLIVEEAIGASEAEALASLTRALRDALGGWVPGKRPTIASGIAGSSEEVRAANEG